jgi:hypothetical protein
MKKRREIKEINVKYNYNKILGNVETLYGSGGNVITFLHSTFIL